MINVKGQIVESDNLLLDSFPTVTLRSPLLQDSFMRLPTNYSTVKPSKLLNVPGNNPLNALNSLEGVFVQSGALNTNRISIRGVGSRFPFGTNRIKAYFMGIPLTGGDGLTELDDVPTDFVDNIELVKGSRSAFFGAGLGGILILNPVRNYVEDKSLSLTAELGSYGSRNVSISGSSSSERRQTLFQASKFDFGGWRENSTYSRINVLTIHKEKINDHSLNLIALYRDYEAEIPSSLNWNDFQNSPESASQNWLNVNGREDRKKYLFAIDSELNFSSSLSGQITLFFEASDSEEYRPFNDLFDSNSRLGIRALVSYKKGRSSNRLLLESFVENYEWQTFRPGQDELLNSYKEIRRPLNLGLQSSYDLSDAWYLEAGLSLNYLSYDLEDLQTGQGEDRYEYDTQLAPFIGVNYKFSESFTAYGSLGYGFSYPSLEETLLPEGQKNPDLMPENGVTQELGLRFKSLNERWFLSASLYRMKLEDLLITERLDNGESIGLNKGSAINSGLDFSFRGRMIDSDQKGIPSVRIFNSISLASFAFDEFEDDGEDYGSNRLPALPTFKSYTRLVASFQKGYSLNLEHQYTSEQYLDDANSESLDSYSVINTGASYSLNIKNKRLDLSLGINNVLNSNYAAMIVPNAPSFGSNLPRYYYPAFPRNFNFKIRILFS